MVAKAITNTVGRRSMGGFTLIELAVVIGIVGLLLGALLTPLATQHNMRKIRATEAVLSDAKEALYGFVASEARMPCPDTDLDGFENLEDEGGGLLGCNANEVAEGVLPWASLGIQPTDDWGRAIYYAVTTEFTNATVPGLACEADPNDDRLDLCDQGTLSVFSRGDDPITAESEQKFQVDVSQSAVAVLVSFGTNGLGGVDLAGTDYADPIAGTDEAENVNSDADNTFVWRTRSPPAAPCDDGADEDIAFCEFDDVLTWIPTPRIFSELVKVQKLP